MEDDWDLHAVVRGCAAASAANNANSPPGTFQQDCSFSNSLSQDPFETRREREELHELYRPFFPQDSSQLLFSLPISPLSVLGDLPAAAAAAEQPVMKQLPLVGQKPQSFSVSDVSKSHNSIPRSKRRKNHLKRVCHVAAENLSSDMWSWRKYGQKPIKGSPYPRGYYRCSTLKGCMARKQVERNRSDPGMFIVTYTAEHNHPMPTHRNSLAGSTRHKPPTSDDPSKPSSSPETSVMAPPEKLGNSREDFAEAEDDDQGPSHMQVTSSGSAPDDDDDLSVSKMAMDDDFFSGLEGFTADDGDCTSGQFPSSLPFPWVSSSGATTISDGG